MTVFTNQTFRSVRTITHSDIIRDASGKPIIVFDRYAFQTRFLTRAQEPQPRWERVTELMAFDCEFSKKNCHATGVNTNMPGRVSVTNSKGEVVYDVFAYHPYKRGHHYWTEKRHKGFGCYEEDVKRSHGARPIAEVEENLHYLFQDAVMIGHATKNDLGLFEGWVFDGVPFRDTQEADEYREYASPRSPYGPALRNLARYALGYEIQGKEHSSVEDARATMELYLLHEESIEMNQAYNVWCAVGTAAEIQKCKDLLKIDQVERSRARLEEKRKGIAEQDTITAISLKQRSVVSTLPISAAAATWMAKSAHIKSLLRAPSLNIETRRHHNYNSSSGGMQSPASIEDLITPSTSETDSPDITSQSTGESSMPSSTPETSRSTTPIESTTITLDARAAVEARTARLIAYPLTSALNKTGKQPVIRVAAPLPVHIPVTTLIISATTLADARARAKANAATKIACPIL
jgi:RNA exonuclease 4